MTPYLYSKIDLVKVYADFSGSGFLGAEWWYVALGCYRILLLSFISKEKLFNSSVRLVKVKLENLTNSVSVWLA